MDLENRGGAHTHTSLSPALFVFSACPPASISVSTCPFCPSHIMVTVHSYTLNVVGLPHLFTKLDYLSSVTQTPCFPLLTPLSSLPGALSQPPRWPVTAS